MKVSILTNFDDYDNKISCDKYGVITLTLTPKRVNEINLHHSIFNNKETLFKEKYCTLYKKSDNEFLYKYTNYMPNNNFDYDVVNIEKHMIPYNFDNVYHRKTFKSIKSKYYYNKMTYYREKYLDI